jgi:hypothetical protein
MKLNLKKLKIYPVFPELIQKKQQLIQKIDKIIEILSKK